MSYFHLWPSQLNNILLHFPINGKNFVNKVLEYKMCVLSLQLLSATFLILRTERNIINVLTSACDVPVILARFYSL